MVKRMFKETKINWPDYYHPRNAQIHVKNAVPSKVPAERVWACLIKAPCWPTWKNKATSVQLLNGNGLELEKGTVFLWKTKKLQFECTVVEFVPNKKIAWKGKSGGIDMYHAWKLDCQADGCSIITETTQRNGISWFTKFFLPKQINSYHQHWLEELQQQAR